MLFDTEKLEWRGHQMVKNFDDTFIRFDTTLTNVTDRHTHRDTLQTDTA